LVWPHILPMIELGALLLFGVAIVALIVAFAAIVKALFWVVLLPVRLVFWGLGAILMVPLLLLKVLSGGFMALLAVPLFLVKAVFGGLMALLAVPLFLLGLVVAAIALIFGVLLPALPLILLVGLFWLLVRPEPARLARN
jgi:hypothetical protein